MVKQKTDYNKHKKVILADFDPYLQAYLGNFFNILVLFWLEGTNNINLYFAWKFPLYVNYIFLKKRHL